MEAREEKLLRARASFQSEGSPKNLYCEKNEESITRKYRGVFLTVRILISCILLALFIYTDLSKNVEMNKISKKSFVEIRKNEINIEKYSALISQMW